MKKKSSKGFSKKFGDHAFFVNSDDVVVTDGIFPKVLYRDADTDRLRIAQENPPIPRTIPALRRAKPSRLFGIDDLQRILHWDERTILKRLRGDRVPAGWHDMKAIYYFQRDLIAWIDKNNIAAGPLKAGRPPKKKELNTDGHEERAGGSQRRTSGMSEID